MTEKFEGCRHCGNEVGFTFGTCIECGFNNHDWTFHWIKVQIDELHVAGESQELIDTLTKRHSSRTKR